MRTGYTTGAVATACVAAALERLLTGREAAEVAVRLPGGESPLFRPAWTRLEPDGSVTSACVKDGGDDPDATHGAEIRATVRLPGRPGPVRFLQGEGVGRVTLRGLGLEPGEPAINPVPRRMIAEHAGAALAAAGREGEACEVTVSVKDGAAIAAKTLNARLGILGGISILGRSGIVHPYSHEAFKATVEQAVAVAAAQGQNEVVLSTGGLTEDWARALRPDLPGYAFVQMGDWVAEALDACAARGIRKALLCGQLGKLAKLSQGLMNTHASSGEVDLGLLARLAAMAEAPEAACAEIAAAATARRALELAEGRAWRNTFVTMVTARAALAAQARLLGKGGKTEVEVWMFGYGDPGELIGEARA